MPKIKITEHDFTGYNNEYVVANAVYIPGYTEKSTSELEYKPLTEKPLDWETNYTSYYKAISGATITYAALTKQDLAPTYEANTYYQYSEGVYELLAEEPQDWTTTYDSYYVEVGETGLVKCTPLFVTNTYYKEETTPAFSAIEAAEYLSVSELEKSGLAYDIDLLSYKLMVKLLSLNIPVVYEQFIAIPEDFSHLVDKRLFPDVRFLTLGAEDNFITVGNAQALISCAESRGDCVALLDVKSTVSDVATIRSTFESYTAEGSAFAAGFTPWFKLNDVDFADISIPASFGYLLAYVEATQNNPEWYAVAGSFRGIIPGIKSVDKVFTSAEIEVLQGRSASSEVDLDYAGDNIGIAINPIANIKPFGLIIWGNRTVLKNEDTNGDNVGDLKATSFLNVRNLVISVKKQLYKAATKYTFEQNSTVLWVNFTSEIIPLLEKMKSGNGIVDYRIVKQPTTQKARLKAKIILMPIEAVEDFELEIELTDSLEVVE